MAAPEAHILRIDPRASTESGDPLITMVAEIVQTKRVGDATSSCAALTGNSLYDCMSGALEKPGALYEVFPFPKDNAIFSVKIDGSDNPAKLVSVDRWGEQLNQPGVGTAWLIMIDADARMRGGFEEAKQVAERFVASMGRNDIVNVMMFNDRAVFKDSKWVTAADKAKASTLIRSQGAVMPSSGRNRSLLTILKTGVTDAFKNLGNVGENINVPMHQALVVLSSGFGGTDPSTTGPGAIQLSQYLTGGRFPEDNTALPKSPLPVISIWFPHTTYDEFKQNSMEFMQNLANPEIGGLYTIMRGGQGHRADTIVKSVRTRFSKMYLVKWRVSCVATSVTQTFGLVFNNVKPPIVGDNTFKDVPVGIDPTTWPLDVNHKLTQDEIASAGGVYPGGKFKVFGNFCWGGDTSRAEVYFLPAGQAPPAAIAGANIEQAKKAQQQLVQQGMKGKAIEANDTYAEFEAPDNDKMVHGSGSQAVARVVLFDNKAKRTSGVTADTILQVKATQSGPFPILYVLVGLFGVTVLLLLVVVIVRSGGRNRRPPPPAPMPPGGGYGPPGGYGGGGGYPPAGGGYPPAGGGYPPAGGQYGGGGYGGGGPYGAAAMPPVGPPPGGPANVGALSPEAGLMAGGAALGAGAIAGGAMMGMSAAGSPAAGVGGVVHAPPTPAAAPPGFAPIAGGVSGGAPLIASAPPTPAAAPPGFAPSIAPAAAAPADIPDRPPDGAPVVSPEFMYGAEPPKYGVTTDAPAQPMKAPPDPYRSGVAASRAVLQGPAGVFTVMPGVEMRVGRDGSQCAILLTEPRVSGLHASVKLDGGELLLRDDHSNNGTFINGARITPGNWQRVHPGSLLRFGPAEFSVSLE